MAKRRGTGGVLKPVFEIDTPGGAPGRGGNPSAGPLGEGFSSPNLSRMFEQATGSIPKEEREKRGPRDIPPMPPVPPDIPPMPPSPTPGPTPVPTPGGGGSSLATGAMPPTPTPGAGAAVTLPRPGTDTLVSPSGGLSNAGRSPLFGKAQGLLGGGLGIPGVLGGPSEDSDPSDLLMTLIKLVQGRG